ncbi:AMP-binding protein [Bradyrhizobium zhanjiangense]|uniref:AMP-dependent synthetase/ligase domain-containing protein n=1 Tax=Bradyrhizobium zhanjiangense TaxID=1325107 RepID=A0ABY0D9T9_9BRAD|nr:AMP-binding protein [Bradyrhizobium zhanjiangense]RXG86624.1 hypothetical protein EAS62_37075 [Bradyrhizobium zhanjiangense]
MRTIHELITRQSVERPEMPFLRFEGNIISFSELRQRVSSVSAVLREIGVKSGDRVGLMMTNHPDHVIIYLALAWLGAISVEVATDLNIGGIQLQLHDAEPQFFIVESQFVPEVKAVLEELRFVGLRILVRDAAKLNLERPFHSLRLDQPFATCEAFSATLDRIHTISYASGTVEGAKGTVLTERFVQIGANSAAVLADVRDNDVLFLWEPFCHNLGWTSVLIALQHGISIALVECCSGSKCWDQIRESGATILHYFGGAMNILLERPPQPNDRDNSIRVAWGATAPKASRRIFQERFGITVRECYGLSEPQNVTHLNLEGRLGSIGKPIEDLFECWIIGEDGKKLPNGEIGEIVVRPKLPGIVMRGYFRDPKRTAEVLRDGCVYTGDLGYQDNEGFFFALVARRAACGGVEKTFLHKRIIVHI